MNASTSVDEDEVTFLAFNYGWRCEDLSGDVCVSTTGELLDVSAFANGGVVSIPAGSLEIGEGRLRVYERLRHAVNIQTPRTIDTFATPTPEVDFKIVFNMFRS